jgi:hypothetical protein
LIASSFFSFLSSLFLLSFSVSFSLPITSDLGRWNKICCISRCKWNYGVKKVWNMNAVSNKLLITVKKFVAKSI